MSRYAEPQDRQPQEFRVCSLEECASALGVSRQRVNQIEKTALKKLRRILEERYGITSAAERLPDDIASEKYLPGAYHI